MALSEQQQLALYLLMGKHSDAADGKSALRTYVEANGSPGYYGPALRAGAKQLDRNIADGDIGDLADLNPASIRGALGIMTYTGTGPCLDYATEQRFYGYVTS